MFDRPDTPTLREIIAHFKSLHLSVNDKDLLLRGFTLISEYYKVDREIFNDEMQEAYRQDIFVSQNICRIDNQSYYGIVGDSFFLIRFAFGFSIYQTGFNYGNIHYGDKRIDKNGNRKQIYRYCLKNIKNIITALLELKIIKDSERI